MAQERRSVKTWQLALLGNPVSHSPSPGIHKAFGRQFGLEIEYRLIESTAGTFTRDLEQFRTDGGQGCNITLPLKHDAFRLADLASAGATLAGAANTLWWDSENRINADNTDGFGLVRDIEQNLGFPLRGKNLLILGAGGATAGVLGALLNQDPARITIANRTVERAESLADRHSGLGEVLGVSLAGLSGLAPDLLIDATSLGHNGTTPDIPESLLKNAQMCYSLNYGAAAQPMRHWCKTLGVPFQEGLGMLVEQAARAFEIWTALTPQTQSVYKDLDYAIRQSGA